MCKLQHLMEPVLEPIIRRVVSPEPKILASEVLLYLVVMDIIFFIISPTFPFIELWN